MNGMPLLTVKEIVLAITQMPPHKMPGQNVFPTEWYNKRKPLLRPYLLCTFNAALDASILPPSMREALIFLILKPCKDPLD